MIHQQDLEELRRLATNIYDSDSKEQINRIVRGINLLNDTLNVLKAENAELKKQLSAKKAKKD